MENIFRDVCAKFEAELIEFHAEDDHVSLIINYPPQTSIPVLIATLKSISSRLIRKKWKKTLPASILQGAFWARSYLAVSRDGTEDDVIRKFLEERRD